MIYSMHFTRKTNISFFTMENTWYHFISHICEKYSLFMTKKCWQRDDLESYNYFFTKRTFARTLINLFYFFAAQPPFDFTPFDLVWNCRSSCYTRNGHITLQLTFPDHLLKRYLRGHRYLLFLMHPHRLWKYSRWKVQQRSVSPNLKRKIYNHEISH